MITVSPKDILADIVIKSVDLLIQQKSGQNTLEWYTWELEELCVYIINLFLYNLEDTYICVCCSLNEFQVKMISNQFNFDFPLLQVHDHNHETKKNQNQTG